MVRSMEASDKAKDKASKRVASRKSKGTRAVKEVSSVEISSSQWARISEIMKLALDAERFEYTIAAPMRAKSKKKDGGIGRPRNAFIIFRSCLNYDLRNDGGKKDRSRQLGISEQAGALWRAMSADQKAVFHHLANEDKASHEKLHPEYSYSDVLQNARSKSSASPGPSYSSRTATPEEHSSPPRITSSPYSSDSDHAAWSSPDPVSSGRIAPLFLDQSSGPQLSFVDPESVQQLPTPPEIDQGHWGQAQPFVGCSYTPMLSYPTCDNREEYSEGTSYPTLDSGFPYLTEGLPIDSTFGIDFETFDRLVCDPSLNVEVDANFDCPPSNYAYYQPTASASPKSDFVPRDFQNIVPSPSEGYCNGYHYAYSGPIPQNT